MNVYEATKKRLDFIFNEFENVIVSFSGGKDSGVLLNIAYEKAKELKMIDKLSFYYMDYEAEYQMTEEYVSRTFDREDFKEIKKYWLCLPISAQTSASMFQNYWTPWDEDSEELWVKDLPNEKYVVTQDEKPFEFKFQKGDYGADTRRSFVKGFSEKYGSTAVLVGLRSDESLNRWRVFHGNKTYRKYYKDKNYSKIIDEKTINFYPIFDWKTEDIWIANAKNLYDYNKVYDYFYYANIPLSNQRTASPFNSHGISNLKLFKAISPDKWAKMVGRVDGVNFSGIYGGTTAMGWQKVKKPDNFTWKEYAFFLIDTLPDFQKEKILKAIERLDNNWRDKGYGRNEEVIDMMREAGADIELTGQLGSSKIYTKPKKYEIVKIKNGFVEESSHPSFRHIPSWKGVVITILKNDFSLQTMGLSRTKQDLNKRREALEKYEKL